MATAGVPVYQLDQGDSRVEMLVRRNGPLARLGHDHVVVARQLEGWMAWHPDPSERRADLRIAVNGLSVDPAEARERYQLDTTPSASDIESTRSNMMSEVLLGNPYPWIPVSVDRIDGGLESPVFHADITIRGNTRRREIRMKGSGPGPLVLTGSTIIRQSDFGLEPMSALGGGLRVDDELRIQLELRSTRLP